MSESHHRSPRDVTPDVRRFAQRGPLTIADDMSPAEREAVEQRRAQAMDLMRRLADTDAAGLPPEMRRLRHQARAVLAELDTLSGQAP